MKLARLQRGFGLLEAVVALVLFALVGGALFAWVNTNLDAAARLRQRDRAHELIQLASAWLQTRNPMTERSGDTELIPGARLRWQTRALTPVTPGAPLPGGTQTPFRFALFEIDATVLAADGGAARFTLQRLGAERDPITELVPGR